MEREKKETYDLVDQLFLRSDELTISINIKKDFFHRLGYKRMATTKGYSGEIQIREIKI